MDPLDYSLCSQTVTIYRENLRFVAENCYVSCTVSTPAEPYGKSLAKQTRLIIPGDRIPLKPGDRVFPGIGPRDIDWETFLPANVPGLFELTWAKPLYWLDRIAHWEGG